MKGKACLVPVAIGMLLLAACGGGAAPAAPATSATPKAAPAVPAAPAASPAAQLTPLTFETAWIPVANQLPWFYAQEKGYFKAAGLDVKIVSGKGSVLSAQQTGAGRADIGQADLTVTALVRAKGEPVKAILVEFPKSPYGIFGAKSAGIKTFTDLKGKTLIVSAGAVENFLLPPTLKKVGVALSQVKQIDTNPSIKDQDYIQGKADALANEIPANSPVVDPKRPSNHLYFGDVLNVPYLGLLSTDGYIAAHPAAVQAFVQVTQKAQQELMASPAAVQDAADYVAKTHAGVSAAVLVASWKQYAGFFQVPAQQGHPFGWMPPAMWQQTIDLLHQYAGLKGDLNPQDYYTNRYANG